MEKKIAMAGAMLLSKRPLEAHQPSDTGLENVENVPPESDSRQGPPQTQTDFPGFSTQRPSVKTASMYPLKFPIVELIAKCKIKKTYFGF